LVKLEEDIFIAGFHQQVQKEREKAFKQGDLVLVYDSKFIKHPGKFRTHWFGPYEVTHVTEGGFS
jgi:hypothetical protein